MKKLLLCLLLLGVAVKASDTQGNVGQAIRYEVAVMNNAALPDSVLYGMIARSVKVVSTECGGVEMNFKLTTVPGQAFYAIPDTVVMIWQATIIRDMSTYDLRAAPSQYFQEEFEQNTYDLFGNPSEPVRYSMSDDSVQLYPIPNTADSIFLKTYVEHHDVGLDDTCAILMDADYVEAVIVHTIYLIYKRFQEYEIADRYKLEYAEKKKELLTRHFPRHEYLSRAQ